MQEVYKKLLDKHADAWDTLHLKLWARMICSGCYDNPPSIPAFTSTAPKKQRKDSLSDALTGAAVAFAKAVSGGTPDKFSGQSALQESPACSSTSTVMPVVSPGKAVDLRTNNFAIYNNYMTEFLIRGKAVEQKQEILNFLRKL